jgi:hypothetical protein
MDWQEVSGNWILVPPRPTAIVHFLGGAFVAAAPQVTYRWLLENLARQGYAIVATPFVNTMDHTAIARQVLQNFIVAQDYLQTNVFKKRYFPVYGMGHSMGCKLHLLIGSLYPQERAGNILISFNNFPARRSIPLVEQFVQFSPAFERQYQVRRNLLIKFTNDDIDQTKDLTEALLNRFPDMTALKILKGSHLTPLGQEVGWQTGSVFTPLDAIGQLFKQEVYRDLNQLKDAILLWLNPLAVRG